MYSSYYHSFMIVLTKFSSIFYQYGRYKKKLFIELVKQMNNTNTYVNKVKVSTAT